MRTGFSTVAYRPRRAVWCLVGLIGGWLLLAGCPVPGGGDDGAGGDVQTGVFNNTSDPTNDGAQYIGSDACSACHGDFAALHRIHGHANALTAIQGQPPQYPEEGTRAGVPTPPAGLAWSDISYVISGYLHNAFFVDDAGYVMTNGVDGVDTQYLLGFPPNGTQAGFTAYLPNQATPKPFDYETCFRCHTTGPQPLDPANPVKQDNRPGILGTWAEANVQCEACHGPGSNHAPNPGRRDLFVDLTAQTCARCHVKGNDPDVIVAENGYANPNTQYPQLRASGGHSDFSCTVCHDPHASITYDRANGLRNDCTVCHADQNMAFHAGKVFSFGDYEETLACESCHMPLLGLSGSTASAALVGSEARVGDVRGHIFRLDATSTDVAAMFTADGSAIARDENGLAAVTVHFACLRCHNASQAAFALTAQNAARIAENLHGKMAETGP